MKQLISVWHKLLHWIETGDFVPLLILVSVAHYIEVLRARDFWFVAAAIGLLVDLGQYRLLKAALRFGGWWWAPSAIMTLIALGYHYAFYSLAGAILIESMLLALPIPFLIIVLSALSAKENWARRVKPTDANPVPTIANGNATGTPPATRWQYGDFAARHSVEPLNARQIVAIGNVPLRTAYNWLAKYEKENGGIGFKTPGER